ncbi:MAG: leucine-rich repeat domain-containing protein, partial [archaeon]|nr:leucine-rich repeat domain-containing protein [archaeon]
NDGTTVPITVTRGETIDQPRPVYGYYTDPDMTETWSPLTRINHDVTVYALVEAGGSAGGDTVWRIDFSTGTLTVSGTGRTSDWTSKTVPWYAYRNHVSGLVVEEGVTYLGAYACYKYPYLNDIVFSDSLEGTGKYAVVTSVAEHVRVGSGLTSLGMRGLFGMTFHEGDEEIAAKDFNLVSREFVGVDGSLYLKRINGSAGDVSWYVDYGSRTLTLTGDGSAGNWSATTAPWYQFRGYFEKVVVEEGVTEIGDFSFYAYSKIRHIVLADSVVRIGVNALRGCTGLESISFGDGLTTLGSNALFGYDFRTAEGKSVKATVSNMKGHTFEGPGDRSFVLTA